jgi:hypothetical protein
MAQMAGPIFNHEHATQFLNLLWPLGVPNGEVLIVSAQRPGQGVNNAAADDLAGVLKLAAHCVQMEANVWLNIATRTPGVKARGGLADCLTLPALWADLDVAENAPPGIHKTAAAFATYADADKFLTRFPPPASAIVRTGYGYSAWWVLDEPQPVAAAGPVIGALKLTMERLSQGRADTSVYEPARMMRLPGTWNMKRPENPQPVTLVGMS